MTKSRQLAFFALLLAAAVLHPACGLSTEGTGNDPTCQPCTAAPQCPSTVCSTSTCGADGCCVVEALPDGVAPGSTQSAGDCHTATCAGGVLGEADEPSDFVDDGEECTIDGCGADGEPFHTAKYDPITSTGEPCANGTGECSSGGKCIIQCSATQPCPPPDDPCVARTCDIGAGTCLDEQLHGVAVPGMAQDDGDCRFWLCANGRATNAVDDADLPVDGKECTTDVCNSGTPSNPSKGADTPCVQGGGSVCSAADECVECNVAAQCPSSPSDTFCKTTTCTAGQCGTNLTMTGTALPVQNTGDCKTEVCDGSGNQISIAEVADLPNDNNACTSDLCVGSTPQNPNLSSGTPCGANSLCNGTGSCVGCLSAMDCQGTDDFCKTRTCINDICGYSFTPNNTPFPPADQTFGDCLERQCDGGGNEKVVANNADLPIDAFECTNDICSMGSPSNPPKAENTPCSMGFCSLGTCYECNLPAQCPAGGVCQTVTCNAHNCGLVSTPINTPIPAQTNGDCKIVVCNGAGGTMVNADVGDLPNDGNPCTSDSCNGPNPMFTNVSAGTPCGAGNSCDGAGVCKKNDGQACLVAGECLNDNCVDGFCCNTACAGTCIACSALKKGSGANGVCGPIANDTDPDNECLASQMAMCGNDGLCNGAAGCGLWASGTVCAAGSCSNGTQQTVDLCNGSGMCLDGGTMACTPYTCGATTCKVSCAGDADCVGTHYCMGSVCTVKKANGVACSGSGNQCQSGFCVDGVCCDAVCNGLCAACTAAKKGSGADGVCGGVANDTDPDNECTPSMPSTCGNDGACNGSGACGMWSAGTVCVPGSCANATTQNDPDTCNGTGMCIDQGTTLCTPLVCSGSSCLASCLDDGDCAPSAYCELPGGTCEPDLAVGATCTSDSQCPNDFCVDGKCCTTACTAICQACAASLTNGADGTCAFIDQLTDDAAPACNGNSTCNGAGACLLDNGQPCMMDDVCASGQCNGAGPTCN